MKQRKSADDDLFKSTIADFERHIIVSMLEQTGGNQTKAAERLGTTKRILMYRVRKYGIDLGQYCGKQGGTREKSVNPSASESCSACADNCNGRPRGGGGS